MIKKNKIIVWFLIFCMMQQMFFISSASANTSKTKRLYGSDRYKTAIAISQYGWKSSEYAVLARGDEFADALCAGPLAKKFKAPILMTQSDALNSDVLTELKRLGVKNVFIIGGTGAVSLNAEDTLKAAGIKFERIYGSDRYETSVKIAEKLGQVTNAAIATGLDFPDALSISAIASKLCMPILLTEKDNLPSNVKKYIDENKVSKTYIVGGTGVISDNVKNALPGAVRLGGKDRYDTNLIIMNEFSHELDFLNIYAAVGEGTDGDGFADALAGAVVAANTSSPLVLSGSTLPSATGDFIKSKVGLGSKVIALGGDGVLPEAVTSSMQGYIGGVPVSANYNKAGIYGPSSGTDTIKGNLVISSEGVTLQNVVIEGDFLLSEDIGTGNVTLNNVTVKGRTIVRGGGPNSIVMLNFNGQTVVVDVPDRGKVRLVTKGDSSLGSLIANSDSIIEEDNTTDDGFTDIVVGDGVNVTLIGDFDTVDIEGSYAGIELKSGTVKTLNVNAPANITGSGAISTAYINSQGVSISQTPGSTIVKQGITANVGGKTTAAPTAAGGGGGGSSPGETVQVNVDSIISNDGTHVEVKLNSDLESVSAADFAFDQNLSIQDAKYKEGSKNTVILTTGHQNGSCTYKLSFNNKDTGKTLEGIYTGQDALNHIGLEGIGTYAQRRINGYDIPVTLNDNSKVKNITSLKISLYKEEKLLATNIGKSVLFTSSDLSEGNTLNARFDIDGNFTNDNWTLGKWGGMASDIPTRVVIELTDNTGRYIAEKSIEISSIPETLAKSVIWVDDDWAGSEYTEGTEVGEGRVIGTNAFADISSSVAAVAPGGTLNIAPGLYNEPAPILINNGEKDFITVKGPEEGEKARVNFRMPTDLPIPLRVGLGFVITANLVDIDGLYITCSPLGGSDLAPLSLTDMELDLLGDVADDVSNAINGVEELNNQRNNAPSMAAARASGLQISPIELSAGIVLYGSRNCSVVNNELTGMTAGIIIMGAKGNGQSAVTNSISHNSIHGNRIGFIQGPSILPLDNIANNLSSVRGTSINKNKIYSNMIAVGNLVLNNIDASLNWWGSGANGSVVTPDDINAEILSIPQLITNYGKIKYFPWALDESFTDFASDCMENIYVDRSWANKLYGDKVMVEVTTGTVIDYYVGVNAFSTIQGAVYGAESPEIWRKMYFDEQSIVDNPTTIDVRPGVYQENITIDRSVVLKGQGIEEGSNYSTIRGNVVVNAGNATINGFKIEHNVPDDGEGMITIFIKQGMTGSSILNNNINRIIDAEGYHLKKAMPAIGAEGDNGNISITGNRVKNGPIIIGDADGIVTVSGNMVTQTAYEGIWIIEGHESAVIPTDDDLTANNSISNYCLKPGYVGFAAKSLNIDEFERDNPMRNAKEMSIGTSQVHTINPDGDADWIKISPVTTGTVAIATSNLWPRFTDDGLDVMDTEIVLYCDVNNDGTLDNSEKLSTDDNGNNSVCPLASKIVYTIDTSGATYYIKIKHHGTGIGQYDISVDWAQAVPL